MTLAIYCAGGAGKEILEFARSISRWDEIVFVDDVIDATECNGAAVCKFVDFTRPADNVEFIIANGEPANKKMLYEKVKAAGYHFTSLISPYAALLPGVQIGEGCIIYDCGISNGTVVGNNIEICSRAIIGHNSILGDHGIISANCFLGGWTQIGESVYMGPGSMTKDRIKVGDNAIISLGAVLLRNVRPGAIMVGNPARRLGYNEQHKVFGMFDG